MAKKWSVLRDRILADPERAARVKAEYERIDRVIAKAVERESKFYRPRNCSGSADT